MQFDAQGNMIDRQQYAGEAVKAFMSRVFSWMSLALIITAVTSYAVANIPGLTEIVYRVSAGKIVGYTGIGLVCMFAPLGLVLTMGLGFSRFSFPVLSGLFLLYALLNGVSLSVIFMRYDLGTIGATFGIAAGMFGIMAVMGFITKADLSRFGAILLMALVGLIIASLVNFFMHSEGMSYLISFAGVAIFTGLTAYDVQKLKQIGAGVTYGNESAAKLSIMGAFTLYLDFINIFLFLLRLMGGNRR